MRPWRGCIHIRLADGSVTGACIDLSLNFLVWGYRHLICVLNIDTPHRILSHLEVIFGLIWLFNQQILNFFIVDLDHLQFDLMLYLVGGVLLSSLDTRKDFLTNSRNDAFILAVAHNWIWLAGACLPVCEQTSVKALKSIVKNLFTQVPKYFILICVATAWLWPKVVTRL